MPLHMHGSPQSCAGKRVWETGISGLRQGEYERSYDTVKMWAPDRMGKQRALRTGIKMSKFGMKRRKLFLLQLEIWGTPGYSVPLNWVTWELKIFFYGTVCGSVLPANYSQLKGALKGSQVTPRPMWLGFSWLSCL